MNLLQIAGIIFWSIVGTLWTAYLISRVVTRIKKKAEQRDERWSTLDAQSCIIGEKLSELLNTITDAEKIDCTCDKRVIKMGAPCICVRNGAVKQAGIELDKYLRKLRKGLK